MPPKKIKARGSFSLAPAHSPSFPTNLQGPNNTAAKTVNYREEDPESWFLIIDLIFLTHNITSPQMKFHLVLPRLPTQMAASNRLVECFHGWLKDALPSRCPASDWSAHLPWVLTGIRAVVQDNNDPHPSQVSIIWPPVQPTLLELDLKVWCSPVVAILLFQTLHLPAKSSHAVHTSG